MLVEESIILRKKFYCGKILKLYGSIVFSDQYNYLCCKTPEQRSYECCVPAMKVPAFSSCMASSCLITKGSVYIGSAEEFNTCSKDVFSLCKDSYIFQILGNCACVFWGEKWREVA